jgi:hypothetical protein
MACGGGLASESLAFLFSAILGATGDNAGDGNGRGADSPSLSELRVRSIMSLPGGCCMGPMSEYERLHDDQLANEGDSSLFTLPSS